jgi:hypothetical protein
MSVGSNPPPSPPMLSPDHKWVWDGTQWQPVADPNDPARKAVFAAFAAAAQDLPTPVATARPATGQARPIGVPYTVARPRGRRPKTPAPNQPLWTQRKTGLNKVLYISAAAVAILIGVVLVLNFLPVSLPWANASGTQPAPVSAGPALADRSDFARADQFLKAILPPALARLDDVMGPVREGCNGSLTLTCQYAIPPAQKQAKNLLSAINAATVPDCIASNYARIRLDATGVDNGLKSMQSGYDQNSVLDMKNGVAHLLSSRQALTADVVAAGKAQQAGCDPQVTGP